MMLAPVAHGRDTYMNHHLVFRCDMGFSLLRASAVATDPFWSPFELLPTALSKVCRSASGGGSHATHCVPYSQGHICFGILSAQRCGWRHRMKFLRSSLRSGALVLGPTARCRTSFRHHVRGRRDLHDLRQQA